MLDNVIVFIFGSCLGSFLNVCIYRLPKDKSVVVPRSFCPQCTTAIAWYDNIPMLSFLLLRGVCRKCSKRIPWRYPLVELLCAVVWVMVYTQFGLTWELAKYGFFFSLLIMVSFIDIDYHAIPGYLCVLGIIVGIGFTIPKTITYFNSGVYDIQLLPVSRALKALIFGLGFCYLFKLFGDVFISIYLTIRKKTSIEGEKEAMGLGDVDFMGMVAVFLGIQQTVLIFFIAPFIATLYSIFALIFKRSHLIPYLPYLSLATVIVFLWGNRILQIILRGFF